MERFGFGELVVAVTTTCEINANWKIVLENYQECLHCTRVHPELVELVPLYRTGWVSDHNRDDGGVSMAHGYGLANADTALPTLPGIGEIDANSYFGGTIFPNGFIDVSGTCAIVSTLFPKGPAHTTMTMQYMFAPSTVAADGFDPTAVVEFNELVAAQDNMVCERVQLGVGSRSFEHGVLSPKDELVVHLTRHYLRTMGRID